MPVFIAELLCGRGRAFVGTTDDGGGSPQSISVGNGHLDERHLLKRSQLIDEHIEKERIAAKKTLKILLLGQTHPVGCSRRISGGPESGKSTIFKQMR